MPELLSPLRDPELYQILPLKREYQKTEVRRLQVLNSPSIITSPLLLYHEDPQSLGRALQVEGARSRDAHALDESGCDWKHNVTEVKTLPKQGCPSRFRAL